MRLRLRVPLAVLSLLLAAPVSQAWAAWSAPVTVPGTVAAEGLARPSLAFNEAGRGLVTWEVGIEPGRAYRAERIAADRYRSPISLPGLISPPVLFGSTRLADVRAKRPRSGGSTVIGEIGTLTGFEGPDRTLARDIALQDDPAFAGNAHGDLAAVWVQSVGDHDHLSLSLRHPGGRFGRPHVMRGSGRITSAVVAYGERGDTLIVYQRESEDAHGHHYAIESRLRRAHHNFGSVQHLDSSRGFAQIAATIAPNGRAYVVWAEQDAGEEANRALAVHATLSAPNHFLLNRPRTIATAPVAARPQGAPRVVADADGNATAAWSLPGHSVTTAVQVARARAGHWFGDQATVAANGILEDLAGAPNGAALVLWDGAYGATFSPRPVQAAYRAPGASAFGAAETVSPAPEDPFDAVAALDRDGTPVVAWIGRPGYRGEFPPTEDRAIRVSQRSG